MEHRDGSAAEGMGDLEAEIARLRVELTEQHRCFDTLFQGLEGVAIQCYRPDGTVTLWNDANISLYGWTPEEAIGRDLVDLIIPDHMKAYVRETIAEGATGKPMPPAGELLLKHKNGHLVPVYTSHAVVMHTDREADLFCIDLDMRDLKKAEQELRRLKREAELLREKERKRLAGWLHDDLGQDVAVLTMDCDWLAGRGDTDAADVRDRVESMRQGLRSLAGKLRDLAAELRPTTLDHFGLASALAELTSRMANRSGLQAATDLDKGVTLDCDRETALYRVAQELTTNVTRHAEASRFEVRLERKAESVVLSVKDDGRGFPRDGLDLTRTFGLSNLTDRVREMRGTVEIDSGPGRGTTVTVSVPLGGSMA